MASKVTLQRSLRSRWSVKDVPEHFVKDVMELNKQRPTLGHPFESEPGIEPNRET